MKKQFLTLILAVLSVFAIAQTRNANGIYIGPKTDATTKLITKAVSSGGNDLKFYSGSTLLSVVDPDTTEASADNFFSDEDLQRAYTLWLGTEIKLRPLCPLTFMAGGGFTDGAVHLTAMMPKTDTVAVDSVLFMLSTIGDITDTYAAAGIYIDNNDGTYSLVASTGNVSNLFETSARKDIPLTTTYYILPNRKYYSASLLTASATATAAVMVDVGLLTNNFSQYFLNGDNKISAILAGQTSLPATITASATTRTVYMKGFLFH